MQDGSIIGVSISNINSYKHGVLFMGHRQTAKVQVGKDQEKAQSERDSHSKNRRGKKPN